MNILNAILHAYGSKNHFVCFSQSATSNDIMPISSFIVIYPVRVRFVSHALETTREIDFK